MKDTRRSEKALFFSTIGLLIALIGVGLSDPNLLNNTLNGAFDWVLSSFGWWFILLGFVLSVITIFLVFSRYGDLRIGGPDAKPEFDVFSWFAMVFTVGFTSSVIFWGVAEPVSIVNSPPPEPIPIAGASIESLSLAFMYLHNILPGLIAWYLPFALAFGIIVYTRGVEQYKISSMLEPLLDRDEYGWLFWIVDLAALVAIIGGLSTSLGATGQQLAGVLSGVFGFESSLLTYGLFALIGAVFLGDVWLGLRSGIRNAARATVVLVLLFFAILVVVGPTMFILNVGLDSLGIWLDNLIRLSLYSAPTNGGTWPQQWTSFWWAWWCAWGIFVGSFVARVSKGRTVKETFVVLGVAPAILLWVQHAIIGGWALSPGNLEAITTAMNESGYPAAFAAGLLNTPLTGLLGIISVLMLSGYLITSLDSAVFMLASITLGTEEPNARNRAWWGVLLAALGIMTLELPGARALEAFSAVLALPFTVFILAIIYATFVAAREHFVNDLDVETDTLLTRKEAGTKSGLKTDSSAPQDD
nr:BCCT family transporter [Haloferax profundi]